MQGSIAVRLECLHGVQEVEGSNPFAPTEEDPWRNPGVLLILVFVRSPDLAIVLIKGLHSCLCYPFIWLWISAVGASPHRTKETLIVRMGLGPSAKNELSKQ